MYSLKSLLYSALILQSNVLAGVLPRTQRIQDLWQFSNETWVENIAVRANGQIIATTLPAAEIWQVNPFKSEAPILITQLPYLVGAFGIAETAHDVFVVTAGNFTRTGNVPYSYSVWEIDLRGRSGANAANAPTRKIVDIPEAPLLNGVTHIVPGSRTVLIADSINGQVWKLDTTTDKYGVVLSDPLMKPQAPSPLGINGIHTHGDTAYFTSSGQNILASVRINLKTGKAVGSYQTVAHPIGLAPDDFTLDAAGNAYIATNFGETVVRVQTSGRNKGTTSTYAGNANSTVLAGNTACVFGRTRSDSGVLYVSTAGGSAAPVSVDGSALGGGKVIAVYP